MARIDLVDLAHSYGGNAADPQSYALKPISMTWRQGGAYALLGPSGCGKTTLLNLISGIVTPSRGKILFDGVDITPLSTRKRNIAQVFQFPVIYDTMTVGQNLAFPLKNRGVPKAEIDTRVAEIAKLLDLTPDLKRKATRLTADAKQKISLGRGLVRADVAAVLFDEPLTVIDPALKWELRSKLKAVHRALDALGAAARLLEMTVAYAGQREQFGAPIGSFQAVKHHCANMEVSVEAGRSALWAAALALDDRSAGTRSHAVSAAVAYTKSAASQVAGTALQVHGGIGFTWEHDLHLSLRRIKVDEALDGTVTEHRAALVPS